MNNQHDEVSLLYWEDFQPGNTIDCSCYYLSKDEIIDFAKKYDPQIFHVDEVRALHTPLGCLCASGLNTLCVATRLCVDNLFGKVAVVAGKKLDKARFLKPVTPDQNLSLTVTIGDCWDHPTRKELGYLVYEGTLRDGMGDIVLTYKVDVVVQRRNT